MKYMIIGLAILYITVPSFFAISMSYDISEFPSEWWDAFKDFAPMATATLASLVAIGLIVYGILNWG